MIYGSKGQTEAPFQLLIAAVMLSMVIPISFYLFQQYQVWSSKERVQNNMEELARELETVANLGSGEKYISVDLNVYSGPHFSVDYFTLDSPGSDMCMRSCHTPNCIILRAHTLNPVTHQVENANLSPVCVRVPFNVEFVSNSCPPGKNLNTLASNGVFKLNTTYITILAIKQGYQVYLCKPGGEQ